MRSEVVQQMATNDLSNNALVPAGRQGVTSRLSSALARRGLELAESLVGSQRTLIFPQDSIGRLYFSSERESIDARGRVTVLAGEEVSLVTESSHTLADKGLAMLTIVNTTLDGLSEMDLSGLAMHLSTCFSDKDMAHVTRLTGLKKLDLWLCEISDEGLAHVGELGRLVSLNISSSHVTDSGLRHLMPLTNLRELWLSGTSITDRGLECLTPMVGLTFLWLGSTDITDVGLSKLHGLRELRDLTLLNTKVTAAGVDELRSLIPSCRIKWDTPPGYRRPSLNRLTS